MGPGAVAVTQADDRIAILQRSGPLRGYETCRIDRQDARAWQTTRQDLVGRDQRCGDVEAAYGMANAAPAKGSRDSVENKRWSVGQSPGLGAGTGRPCPNTYRIAGAGRSLQLEQGSAATGIAAARWCLHKARRIDAATPAPVWSRCPHSTQIRRCLVADERQHPLDRAIAP